MNHLLQLYQSSPSNFSMTTTTDSLSDKSDNDDNKEMASSNKNYSCTHPGCGKSFRYKSEFTRHELIHSSQGLLNCPFEGCTKIFKRDDILKSHMRTHTGETPYKCEEPGCGQSFAHRASLKYHSLKHTGGKGYMCNFPGCNKTFLTMGQLKQHENARNIHQKLPNKTLSEDENEEQTNNIKIRRCENTSSTTRDANLVKIEAGVEMKNVIIKEENINKSSSEEEFERIVKALIYQNSIMKMKLKMFNMMGEAMQKKKNLEMQYTKELVQLPVQQPSNEAASACFNFEVKSE